MAGRVDLLEVRGIIETELDDPSLSIFVRTAERIVNTIPGLAEDQLSDIALYLSAHFITLREQQVKSEEYGSAENEYQGQTRMYLESSHYGQSALLLDTTGTLYSLGKAYYEFETISC